MNSIFPYIFLYIQGSYVTLSSWLLAGTISLVLGTFLGILSSSKISPSWLRYSIKTYTFIMKGIPAYVQILVAYFVIPHLLGITVSGFFAASLALALCSSGYVTEIIRSQIDALPQGQWDACYALGYPLTRMIQHIILPQALKNALPALLGELEQLLKSTSLLATIGVTELTRAGMNIVSRELNPLPVYLMLATIYLLFSALLTILSWYFTKGDRYARRS